MSISTNSTGAAVQPSTTSKLAYRVSEAAAAIGVSRSKMWQLIAQGRVKAVKIDTRTTVVSRQELESFLASLAR